jgi:hypothetical protein
MRKDPVSKFNEAAVRASKYAARLQRTLAADPGLLQEHVSGMILRRLQASNWKYDDPDEARHHRLVNDADRKLSYNAGRLGKQIDALHRTHPIAGPFFAEALTPLCILAESISDCMRGFAINLGKTYWYVNTTLRKNWPCAVSSPAGLDPQLSCADLLVALLPPDVAAEVEIQKALQFLRKLPTTSEQAEYRVHQVMQSYVDAVKPLVARWPMPGEEDLAVGVESLLRLKPFPSRFDLVPSTVIPSVARSPTT